MKILWFTNTPCSLSKKICPDNNLGGWLQSLECQLSKKNNIELSIAFYHNKKTKPIKYGDTSYYPILRKKRITDELIKRGLNHFLYNDQRELLLLQKVVDTVKPDLIHIHGTEENFGLIQEYISQPVVISIQGVLNPIFEKFFSGIPRSVARRYETFKSRLFLRTQIKSSIRFWEIAKREKDMLQISKHIIGRTNWDRRITSILSPQSNYYHIDEILRDEFYDNPWKAKNITAKKLKIITITNNRIYKGIESIIKTARILHNLTDLQFTWNVIGLTERDTVVKMIIRWLKVNLTDINIKLLGQLPPEKFIPLMHNSDIYCQTSRIENSPNSLCEAMCLGMPVVATFAGGTESILCNNKEGILVQDGDAYSMAGALIELQSNPDRAKEFALNARKRALERHNQKKISQNLFDLYKKILDNEQS